jgi:predicted acyl esterase
MELTQKNRDCSAVDQMTWGVAALLLLFAVLGGLHNNDVRSLVGLPFKDFTPGKRQQGSPSPNRMEPQPTVAATLPEPPRVGPDSSEKAFGTLSVNVSLPLTWSLTCIALGVTPIELKIEVAPGLTVQAFVALPKDSTSSAPRPLVVMANPWGFGASIYDSMVCRLAQAGIVGVEYSLRGWGTSDGVVNVVGPDDIADASAVISFATAIKSWNVDPDRIGVSGVSMGAGWSLLVAAHDTRVKAVAAMDGWNWLYNLFAAYDTPNVAAGKSLLGFAETVGARTPSYLAQLFADVTARRNESWAKAFAKKRSVQVPSLMHSLEERDVPIYLSGSYLDDLFRVQYLAGFFTALKVTHKRLVLYQSAHALCALTLCSGPQDDAIEWFKAYLRPNAGGTSAYTYPPVRMQVGYTVFSNTFVDYPAYPVGGIIYTVTPRGSAAFGGLVTTAAGSASGGDEISFSTTPFTDSLTLATAAASMLVGPPLVNLGWADRTTSLIYRTEPLAAGTLLCGTPSFSLRVSSAFDTWQVYAYLFVDSFNVSFLQESAMLSSGYFSRSRPGAGGDTGDVTMHPLCVTAQKGKRVSVGFALYSANFAAANNASDLSISILSGSTVTIPFHDAASASKEMRTDKTPVKEEGKRYPLDPLQQAEQHTSALTLEEARKRLKAARASNAHAELYRF